MKYFQPVYYQDNEENLIKNLSYENKLYKCVPHIIINPSSDTDNKYNSEQLYKLFLESIKLDKDMVAFIPIYNNRNDAIIHYGFEYIADININPSRRMKPIVKVIKHNFPSRDTDSTTGSDGKIYSSNMNKIYATIETGSYSSIF